MTTNEEFARVKIDQLRWAEGAPLKELARSHNVGVTTNSRLAAQR